jgi:hypothetical protein
MPVFMSQKVGFSHLDHVAWGVWAGRSFILQRAGFSHLFHIKQRFTKYFFAGLVSSCCLPVAVADGFNAALRGNPGLKPVFLQNAL